MGDWPDFSRAASAPGVATSWPGSNNGLRLFTFCLLHFGMLLRVDLVLFLRGVAGGRA